MKPRFNLTAFTISPESLQDRIENTEKAAEITISRIFKDKVVTPKLKGEWEPSLGDYLGELTDEVRANNITHFVTGGPKSYAYKLQKPYSDGNQTVCKIRGITLNYKNALSINFDAVKDMVTTSEKKTITVVDEHNIIRDSKSIVAWSSIRELFLSNCRLKTCIEIKAK
ncbi:Hypothetical predicted protein, partial [Mytilus galloprovincialis]